MDDEDLVGPREHDRNALLNAVVLLCTDRGSLEISPAEIAAHAQVPKAAFFDHFVDGLDCVLAAQEANLVILDQIISSACRDDRAFPDSLLATISAALLWASEHPAHAKLLTTDAPLARGLPASSIVLGDRLTGFLEQALPATSGVDRSRFRTRAVMQGVISVVAHDLHASSPSRLSQLTPAIARLLTGPAMHES